MAMTTDPSTSSRSRPDAARRAFRSGGNAAYPKALVVALCVDETFRTDGTQVFLASVLDLPELEASGPMIKQLRVHWVCDPASTNFSGKVQMQWSAMKRSWSTAVDLITAQTGVKTQVMGAWYTAEEHDEDFGLHLQFLISVANSAGSAQESGRVSAFLEIEFKS